jgi:hypothetical protein
MALKSLCCRSRLTRWWKGGIGLPWGKALEKLLSISPSGSDDVLVTVSAEETSPSKIRLQRRLLFAPIPRISLEGEIVMRGLRSLQELWLTIPLEVRSARDIAVEKFSGLSPEEVRRATMLYLEHSAYDDLRSRDATTSEEQRPSELEETDPIYRVVAAPVVANWETPRNRAPRPRPIEATTEGALQSRATEGVIERSVRRRGCNRTTEHVLRAHAFMTIANARKIYTRRECSGKGRTRCYSIKEYSCNHRYFCRYTPCRIITCRSVVVIFNTEPNNTRCRSEGNCTAEDINTCCRRCLYKPRASH